MRGVRFSTLEELSASVTRRVRQLNSSTDLTGIMDFPKRREAVIRQKGTTLKDYNTLPHIRYSYPVDIAFCAFLLKWPSYILWYLTEFNLLSCSHLCFPILSPMFSRLFHKINYISYEYVLTRTCVLCWWGTWLILSLQCKCTEETTHLKPHCSYRKTMAISALCCTLSQTVHGTQNTLWMCTAIERNIEQ